MIDKKLAPHLNNVVLVEGGARVIKKYKRLMLRRIRWTEPSTEDDRVQSTAEENDDQDDEEDEAIKESSDNKCHLIWEGVTNQAIFDRFRAIYDIRTDGEGRRVFLERGQEHFWNSAINFQPGRSMGFEEEADANLN